MILSNSWETALACTSIALPNGGRAGLIWMYLFVWAGFLTVYMSLAEMASMAPTSGGQYHWVSELAPRKYQRFLSYLVGWLCLLGWQTGGTSTAFLVGTQAEDLVILNHPG